MKWKRQHKPHTQKPHHTPLSIQQQTATRSNIVCRRKICLWSSNWWRIPKSFKGGTGAKSPTKHQKQVLSCWMKGHRMQKLEEPRGSLPIKTKQKTPCVCTLKILWPKWGTHTGTENEEWHTTLSSIKTESVFYHKWTVQEQHPYLTLSMLWKDVPSKHTLIIQWGRARAETISFVSNRPWVLIYHNGL